MSASAAGPCPAALTGAALAAVVAALLWCATEAEAETEIVLVGTGGAVVTSEDGATFTSVPTSTWATLYSVAHGDGTWVAVGSSSTILVSEDGLTWTTPADGPTGWTALYGVTYGGGLWMAVGSAGEVYTSPDAQTWTLRSVGTWTSLCCVAYHDGVFLIWSSSNLVFRSEDGGATWTSHPTPFWGTVLGDITNDGEGRWVITSFSGQAAYSDDGKAWTSVSAGFPITSSVYGVGHGAEGFVASGVNGIATSPDGVAWTARSPPASHGTWPFYYDTAYHEDLGVWMNAGSGGRIATSPDGVTWTAGPWTTWSTLVGIGTRQESTPRWTAGGEDGALAVSPDGVFWRKVEDYPHDGDVHGLAQAEGRWVAVGEEGQIAFSTDGRSWLPTATVPTTADLRDVASGEGMWVAVGGDAVLYSVDGGEDWTAATGHPFGTTDATEARGVAFGDGLWLAVGGDGRVATSPDGATWTDVSASFPAVKGTEGVAFGDGAFLVVSRTMTAQRHIALSATGTTWSEPSVPTGGDLKDAGHGDTWMTVGDGTALTSGDAVAWSDVSLPHPAAGTVHRAAHGLVQDLPGWVTTADDGQVAVTVDAGLTWQDVTDRYPHDGDVLALTPVTELAGAADPMFTTLVADPPKRLANGVEAAQVTVTAHDAYGHRMTHGGADVALTTTLGTLSAVTDHRDGTYTATLTSLTTGVADVGGTLDGIPVAAVDQVLFVDIIALFHVAPGPHLVGDLVGLTDASTTSFEPIKSWKWDLGDGTYVTHTGAGPPAGFGHAFSAPGTFTVRLNVSDGLLHDSHAEAVSIGVPEPLPEADTYSVVESDRRSVQAPGVLGNDIHPLGYALHVTGTTQPDHGTVTCGSVLGVCGDGSFTYTPHHGYIGPDSFSYDLSDGWNTLEGIEVSFGVTKAAPPQAVIGLQVAGPEVRFEDLTVLGHHKIVVWHWWLADAGTSSVADPVARYGTPGPRTVGLKVTDAAGYSDTTYASFLVPADALHPETASDPPVAVASGPERTVAEGETVLLDGRGSLPDPALLSFEWRQVSGPRVPMPVAASHWAFQAPADETVFRLRVYDGFRWSEPDEVTVRAKAHDRAPVASLHTPVRTAGIGDFVILDGSLSRDPDGDVLSYTWAQTEGPKVTLVQDGPRATFEVPGGPLRFRLTVTAGDGTDHADAVVLVDEGPVAWFEVVEVDPARAAVTFHNLPVRNGTALRWDFGDGGAFGHAADPVHVYEESGTYTVRLMVRDATDRIDVVTRDVVVPGPPTAQGPRTAGGAVGSGEGLVLEVSDAEEVRLAEDAGAATAREAPVPPLAAAVAVLLVGAVCRGRDADRERK